MRLSNDECKRQCGYRERIYVAISADLNAPSFSKGMPWEGAYVFKVGSTQACHDRDASLKRDIPERPSYAGVEDWNVIKCWDSEVVRQDEKWFRPWAKTHIRYVKPTPDRHGISREDLYCLTPEQVSGGLRATSDRLNDEIVEVAIRSLRVLIGNGKIIDLSARLEGET
jgi:hypothetical protein